ncbi:MAG TPA: metallophosphoesterase, partial [Candidatus Thermoplasmatota archaeon]|nr:metallophosphoesterase [Candidatus Thermoplasmatota archaeon]
QPVWGRPCLIFEASGVKYLVASELHLGLESDLARRGAYLRSRSHHLAEQLVEDGRKAGAPNLILLGDVKHKYTHTSRQEIRDVPATFTRLSEAFDKILVTPGNHDTGLRELLPAKQFPHVRVGNPAGETVGDDEFRVGLLHGHTWPRPGLLKAHAWLVGHTHAAARLVDEAGQATTEWAWLRGSLDAERVRAKYGRRVSPAVIVFPPYNPLCGGTPINRDGLLGPVGTLVDPSTSALWLLDGRQAMALDGITLATRRRAGAPD